MMTKEEAREFVSRSTWRFAKTMPKIPHSYTILKDSHSPEDFAAFVRLIAEKGYDQRFYSRSYRYLDIDGYQYWTMGPPIGLINRAETHREDTPFKADPPMEQPELGLD